MKQLKLYLDTSILNFYFAKKFPLFQDATKKLLQGIKNKHYRAYISEVVNREIEEAPLHIKKRLKKLIIRYNLPSLKINQAIRRLAGKYISQKVIPVKYEDDALHIAVATIYNLDVVVSWNFSHIVKLKTKQMTKNINKANNYKQLEIVTPLEVIKYGK